MEILVTAPDGKTTPFRLTGDRVSLGRAPRNELAFPEDNWLSRAHLLLEREGDQWFAKDLGSKNGTFLNGVRIPEQERRPIQSGDHIAASRVLLVYPAAKTPDRTVVFQASPFESCSTFLTTLQELLERRTPSASPALTTRGQQWTTPVGALIRAGRELVIRRPLPQLFRVILDLSMEAVGADRGVLMTLEDGELVPQAVNGDNFVISTTVRDRVLKERTSVLVRGTRLDDEFQAQHSIVVQGVQSLIAVPLQTDDRVIGLIYVDSQQFFRTFSQDDLNLLTVMANVAAIRIEHQRLEMVEQAEKLLESELEQAGEIQQRHLPETPPAVTGYELAGANLPSRAVGGDYFDYIQQPDGRILLVVADVAGKGMPAALLMMSVQARLQMLATEEKAFDNLGQLVSRLNRSIASTVPGNRFITGFFANLDPVTGKLAYCNAGHNPSILVAADGSIKLLQGGGPVMGCFPDIPYEEQQAQLDLGSLLVIYSDGVTEAANQDNEDFGESRLEELLRDRRGQAATAVVGGVLRAGHSFVQGPPQDDLTVLIARRLAESKLSP